MLFALVLLCITSTSHASECRKVNSYTVCEIPDPPPSPHYDRGLPDVNLHHPVPTLHARASTFTADILGSHSSAHATAIRHCLNTASSFWPSTIPVKLRVNFTNLGDTFILGAASPTRNWIINGFICPVALAEAVLGQDLNSGGSGVANYDIHMTLNIGSNWYLGTDARPNPLEYDLVTVCLHEVYHGLFMSGGNIGVSVATDASYRAMFIREGVMGRFDSFMGNQDGCQISAYKDNPAYLGMALTGNNLWFSSEGKRIAKLHAPSPFTQGSSLYHLSEAEYGDAESDLMTPAIGSNYAQHNPGSIMLKMQQLIVNLDSKVGADVCEFVNPPAMDDTLVEQDSGGGTGDQQTQSGFQIKIGNTYISGWIIVGAACGVVVVIIIVAVGLKIMLEGKKKKKRPKRRVAQGMDLIQGNAEGVV